MIFYINHEHMSFTTPRKNPGNLAITQTESESQVSNDKKTRLFRVYKAIISIILPGYVGIIIVL